jgi:hypothetical protein
MHTFLVSPLVWNTPAGKAVAVFQERYHPRAEAILKSAPQAPSGAWKLFRMIGLELLAWLREQHAGGVRRLLLDPGFADEAGPDITGYSLDLSELLASGKTLALLEALANLRPNEPASDDTP